MFSLYVSVCSRMGGVCVCNGGAESSGLGLELGFESWPWARPSRKLAGSHGQKQ